MLKEEIRQLLGVSDPPGRVDSDEVNAENTRALAASLASLQLNFRATSAASRIPPCWQRPLEQGSTRALLTGHATPPRPALSLHRRGASRLPIGHGALELEQKLSVMHASGCATPTTPSLRLRLWKRGATAGTHARPGATPPTNACWTSRTGSGIRTTCHVRRETQVSTCKV